MKFSLILAVLSVMPSVEPPRTVAPMPVPLVEEQAEAAPVDPPDVPETLLAMPVLPPPAPVLREDMQTSAICVPGRRVIVPDGREGEVTSFSGGICRVLAYGEAYVSLWQDDMLELVYPQPLPRYQFGH